VTRKSRIDPEKGANGSGSDPATRAVELKPRPQEMDPASKPKSKKPAARKKASRGSKETTRKSAPSTKAGYEPSEEEIRIRAYFISERRMQLSLEGDSDNDWLEARRQLVEEAKRSANEN